MFILIDCTTLIAKRKLIEAARSNNCDDKDVPASKQEASYEGHKNTVVSDLPGMDTTRPQPSIDKDAKDHHTPDTNDQKPQTP